VWRTARGYNDAVMNAEEKLIDLLERFSDLSSDERAICHKLLEQLTELPGGRLHEILTSLVRLVPASDDAQERPPVFEAVSAALDRAVDCLLERHTELGGPRDPLSPAAIELVAEIYDRLDADNPIQYKWLRLLARERTPAALAAFADALVSRPLTNFEQVAEAIAPLFQHADYEAAALFPRLFDGLEHPSVAAIVLDLSNYVTRQELLQPHPATTLTERLADLLTGVVEELERMETNPAESVDSPEMLAQRISQAMALFVPLCDALALIGHRDLVGPLYRAAGVAHRRLQTEAGWALARLGEEFGFELLVRMTGEPGARHRAASYLEELGAGDRIPEEYRTSEAHAEGELAAWLAQPTQFGAAPLRLKVVDAQRLFWPGYDRPVDCYLIRYEYALPGGGITGVGIVGPLTAALRADLSDWSPRDIYAAYAGWSAEHTEIYEIDASQLEPEQRIEYTQRAGQVVGAAYRHLRLEFVGHLFGDEILIATAQNAGRRGVLIVAGREVQWDAVSEGARAPGTREIYDRFKGRKMLAAFNPQAFDSSAPADDDPEQNG